MPETETLPFGLLELDATGRVIRYSPRAEHYSSIPIKDVIGRDFFEDVLPLAEVRELQKRFHFFMAQGEAIEKLSTTFMFEGDTVKVQMLLAVLAGQKQYKIDRLAFVRITSETNQST